MAGARAAAALHRRLVRPLGATASSASRRRAAGLAAALTGLRRTAGIAASGRVPVWQAGVRRCASAGPEGERWCAYYINLTRRTDRREKLLRLLAEENPRLLERLRRIDAVDGSKLDLSDDADFEEIVEPHALERARHASRRGAYTIVHSGGHLVHFDNHLTPGGVACAMSHRLALQAVAEHPTAEWGLILEDDIVAAVPRAEEAIARLVDRLPADWDAVFLGYHDGEGELDLMPPEPAAAAAAAATPPSRSEDEEGAERPRVGLLSGPLYGLFAWVVRKEAAQALLEHAFPVGGQVDHAISWWLVRERGRAYAVEPRRMLFFSYKSEVAEDSDIQTMATVDDVLAEHQTWEGYYDNIWGLDAMLEDCIQRYGLPEGWSEEDLGPLLGPWDASDLPPCEAPPAPECWPADYRDG